MNQKHHDIHSKEFREFDYDTGIDPERKVYKKSSFLNFIVSGVKYRIIYNLFFFLVTLILINFFALKVSDRAKYQDFKDQLYALNIGKAAKSLSASITMKNSFSDFIYVFNGYHPQHEKDKNSYVYHGQGVSIRKDVIKTKDTTAFYGGKCSKENGECETVSVINSYKEINKLCENEGGKLALYSELLESLTSTYLPGSTFLYQFIRTGVNRFEDVMEITRTSSIKDDDRFLAYAKNKKHHDSLKQYQKNEEGEYGFIDKEHFPEVNMGFRCVKYVGFEGI